MYVRDGLTLVSVPKKYWLAIPVLEIYNLHVYDRYISLKEGMVVVDAGASLGVFSIYASRKVGASGKVIAFEPEPISFNALKDNLAASNTNNVIPLNMGLFNKKGIEKLSYQQDLLYCTSMFAPKPDGAVDVQVERLDDALQQLGITHVDFLKIDTEGAGLRILQGAPLQNIDNIAMELHPDIPEENPRQIEQLLRASGFRTKITHHYSVIPYLYATRDPTISLPVVETWQVLAVGGLGLLLLLHRGRKK